ncbi:MAG: PKD domain-containing protein [Bacteroidota bacterium]
MKTFTNRLGAYFGLVLLAIFSLCFSINTTGQKIVPDDAAGQFIRVELMGHSYFSRMMMVNDFQKLENAKVVLADETGVVYIYSLNNQFDELSGRVDQILKNAEFLENVYDKDRETAVINDLISANGDWIEAYALSGERDNENDSCHKSFPFCTNTIYTFPAGVNTQAQSGPNYNCLSTRPNPAWYHLKILDPGPIAIYMFSTPSRDIDFCLWGPFTDPITPCPMTNANGGLTGSKVVDCSYSPDPTETANIPNGLAGQYYILIITNFSNQPCDITFQQSGGTGSTDCTILPPPATSNSPVCVGELLQLNAATVIGAQYQWTGPNGFISNQQNPTITNVQHANAGVYSLTITVGGQTSDPTSTEIAVLDPPTAAISGSASICEGDSTLITINTTGIGPYRIAVSTGSGIPMVVYFFQTPYTFWAKPVTTTTYLLTSISNNACNGTFFGEAVITVRPKPVPGFLASNLCSGLQTQFIDETTIAMGGISTWEWDFGDGENSNMQNPQHIFTNTGIFEVALNVISNTGCEESIVIPLDIQPTPVVNAGPDKTIPYGTNTQLNGSASGGSGSHTYQWQPSNKVDNATILTPNTVLLDATTDYTITATDAGNGCQISDLMTVTITGGPLSGLIQASPAEICIGGSTLLNALPSGGSGNYSYTWTSNPAGFTSSLEDVTVNPMVSTTYFLSVNDGFTTFEAQILVVVNTLPLVNAGTDFGIPHGTNTTLISSVTGGSNYYPLYQWSPASLLEQPGSPSSQTVNLYQSQSFSLVVTDSKGCIGTDEITVTIEGGPLQVNPIADQPTICLNETTTIRAIPGGGSNNYVSFSWSSVPPGFTSGLPNPEVSPSVTTQYNVIVNDGFNTIEGSVSVNVDELPVINLIPDDPRVEVLSPNSIGICVYDTITINADNAGAYFLWSNGAISQTIDILTSGLSFDVQEFQVTVTNPETGCADNASLTAYFTFQNCSYGIGENESDNRLIVYPNPSADGQFNILIEELNGDIDLEVYSSIGKLLNSQRIQIKAGNRFETVADLSKFAKGIYFLKLSGDNVMVVKRLIIP